MKGHPNPRDVVFKRRQLLTKTHSCLQRVELILSAPVFAAQDVIGIFSAEPQRSIVKLYELEVIQDNVS